jgi:ornithine cyclodeaminase
VITACTRSQIPLIKGEDLKPGAHLDLVGGYTPQTREADDEAARRALIFTDRLESAFDVGDIAQPIASGAICETDVLGDLYDLASGAITGRRSAADITLFKNAGGAHLDLMTCETVLERLGAGIA